MDSQLRLLREDIRKAYKDPWPVMLWERIDMLLAIRLELPGGGKIVTCTDEQVYNWRLVAGDDATRTFEYLQADDTPVNLTGYSAACIVDVGAVAETIVGVIDPLVGKVSVTLPAALTTTFRGNGEYRLKLTSGGGQVSTLVYGDLVVKQ